MKQRSSPIVGALLSAGLMALMGCQKPKTNANASEIKIVGGQNAQQVYPFMASLRADWGHLCGASVIGPNVLLTAAHCLANNRRIDSILVGATNRNGDDHSLVITSDQIDRVTVHPSFDRRTLSNDLAVINLKSNLPDKYTPINLDQRNTDTLAGRQVRAIGWGSTENSSNPWPDTLQEVSLPLITNGSCLTYYTNVNQTMVCTYQVGKDACQGDSGGPLFIEENGRYSLIGVSSWGIGCADAEKPGVWADVAYHQSWISQFIPTPQQSFEQVANVAMYGEGDWSGEIERFVESSDKTCLETCQGNPDCNFYFKMKPGKYMYVGHGVHYPNECVLFSGEPWWGSAPQADGYIKTVGGKPVWE